ncbi:MAG: tetratricopeptide repeat protein [Acidobacteriota bacterium]
MNDRESFRRMQKIFIRASELSKSERAAYLDDACAGDPAMRAEVEAMLAADREARDWLEQPDVLWQPDQDSSSGEKEPEMIGPYRLLERLGSGGMGVVYLAEQTEPVRRQVALKLIKAGMDTEQAKMSVLDIDTRTDIYSMGVLLYVVLSGGLPFPSREVRPGGFEALQRHLHEEEPPKPSTRVSSIDEGGIECGVDSRVLARTLKGDLDWIVMKAIAKEPDRRYQSASEFAADVRRYLNDEPVLASAPGTAYRLRKFVRRHRVAVFGVAAGVLLLLGGVVATTSQAVRATRAEHEARIQAALAAEVNEFLVSMLAEANPANHPAGREVTVVEALETATRMVDSGDRSPRLEAEVRRVVGETYHSLSRHEEAEEQTRTALEMLQALERFRRIYGEQHPWVAVATYNLGSTQTDAGRPAQALVNLERAVDLAAGIYPEGHLNLAVMRAKYGECLSRLSRFTEAEAILVPAHTVINAQLGDEHWRTRQAAEMVAELYTGWGKTEEADRWVVSSGS